MNISSRPFQSILLTTALALAGIGPATAQQAPSGAGNEATGERAMPASMTIRQVRQLLGGRGMGMGRAAAVNGYPGPKHVLQQAEALELTEDQVQASQALRTRVQQRSREIGRDILAAERRLSDLFAGETVDRAAMETVLGEIAGLRADLRAVHLAAHLDQAEALDAEQLEKMRAMPRPEHGRMHGGARQERQRMHRRQAPDKDSDG